jgi:hypothetical protein
MLTPLLQVGNDDAGVIDHRGSFLRVSGQSYFVDYRSIRPIDKLKVISQASESTLKSPSTGSGRTGQRLKRLSIFRSAEPAEA